MIRTIGLAGAAIATLAVGGRALGAPAVCVGVVTPSVHMDRGGDAPGLDTTLRKQIVGLLKGPGIAPLPLQALLPAQAKAEAAQHHCGQVLYVTLTQKKASGGLGGLFGHLGSAVVSRAGGMVGYGGGAAGIVKGAAEETALAYAATRLSQHVKAHDEIALKYTLYAGGRKEPAFGDTVKAEAKTDGEDVITPLLTQAATAVVEKVKSTP